MPRTFHTSGGWACVVDERRDLYCWLLTEEEPTRVPHTDRRPTLSLVPGLAGVVALDGKDDYVCALDADGGVHCWGCLLGVGDCKLWPSRMSLPQPAHQIAVGSDGACALLRSAEVWCWGSSLAKQASAPSMSLAEQPTRVPELHEIAQLSATALGRCALHRDGRVSCWGECADDACAAPRPTVIPELRAVETIASNRSYSCAIAGEQRRIQCWGLPDAEHTDWSSAQPRSLAALRRVVTLEGLQRVKQVDLGERFGLAVAQDGALYHWGADHPGGVHSFEEAEASYGRPSYAGTLEPRLRARNEAIVLEQPLDLEVQRVDVGSKVERARVAGYYTCLELAAAERRCEATLERTPFKIVEVWPSVRFAGGATP